MRDMDIDRPGRAMMCLTRHNALEGLKRFDLFNQDVEGAALSFGLFQQLRRTSDPRSNGAMMYHASCFVCAARRVGRLLESMACNRTCFRPPVADFIRDEWRKKRAFYQTFVEPRNAIEHIDAEAGDNTRWAFFNLWNDRFAVTDGAAIVIDENALNKIRCARDAIADAIIREYPDPGLDFLMRPDCAK